MGDHLESRLDFEPKHDISLYRTEEIYYVTSKEAIISLGSEIKEPPHL